MLSGPGRATNPEVRVTAFCSRNRTGAREEPKTCLARLFAVDAEPPSQRCVLQMRAASSAAAETRGLCEAA